MGDRAGSYDLSADFDESADTFDYGSSDAHWVVAVVRLGMPLSFSRQKNGSVTKDVTQGALLRAQAPLVITDDCLHLTVSHNKRGHMGQLSATLKQTDVNYLVEVLPGDWVLAWIVNNSSDFESLRERLNWGETCNGFKDGLKFVGRVHDLRKSFSLDPEHGTKSSSYSLSCVSFSELESQFFYDPLLTSKDSQERDLGTWLARLGYDVEALFGEWSEKGISPNNINQISKTLLDLIIGKGPPAGNSASIQVDAIAGSQVSQSPSTQTEAKFAYLIPSMVGQLLGRKPQEASKGVFSYADILELLQGVQTYENKKGDWKVFIPRLDDDQSSPRRRITGTDMLGTFLPYMPEFANRPIWQVLKQYSNPTINEMYTTLRVNPEGLVMPTVVFRQIPFTTEAFVPAAPVSHPLAPDAFGPPAELATGLDETPIAVTKFLDLPRWKIPLVMIQGGDVGRSDATRTNFVHVYGNASYQANNVSASIQIVQAPPIRDDLDIMRAGLRPYSATVECFVSDQVGEVPGQWMKLIADWTIGSQFTLNGNLQLHGIQAPICVGDNIEFDKVVYHVESVTHQVGIDPGGKKRWTTQLALTNGMRSDLPDGETTDVPSGGDIVRFPIYPGFEPDDNTSQDPGLTLEQRPTSGGPSLRNPYLDVDDQPDPPSQLDADNQDE